MKIPPANNIPKQRINTADTRQPGKMLEGFLAFERLMDF